MRLPQKLSDAIREQLRSVEPTDLRSAVQSLTEGYRKAGRAPSLGTPAERTAYLAVRLPATFAAVSEALGAAGERIPGFEPVSMLDLGAGPGTASLASRERFPTLRRWVAVERNQALASLGQKLMAADPEAPGIEWVSADLGSWRPKERYDLIVASYSLGELSPEVRQATVRRAWEACDGALVIVEPGTRPGFGVVAEVRGSLIQMGAHLAAPCPHEFECPMRAAGDWCHFSTRVERTAEHRRLKQGELGYEDEKFSYVVAAKSVTPAKARIVRHPLRFSGHVKLQLCTPEGLRERTVTRSQKEQYRAVKRAGWGSSWDFD